MASMSIFLAGFLVLVCAVVAAQNNGVEMEMEKEELLGLFEVIDGLLDDSNWAQQHPQPCTDTPWPGVECEIGQEDPPLFHVTKIHIGPDILNPPCKTSATLSPSLNKLPYLNTLSIFNCFLKSPVILSPTLFGALPPPPLEHLALDSNPSLSGEIPPSLANIVSLKVLSLSQNNVQGKIPSEIGGMVNLEQLDLSHNNLSGGVPLEIGVLENLTILDLSWNGLEGQVPCSLGQLQLLEKIDFGSNRFIGEIPPGIGKLKRLVLLDLSYNSIIGPLPETLSGLESLEHLIVDHNPLNTEIPNFLGTTPGKLQTMSLSTCGLKGPLPSSLSSLKHLSALSLDNNGLTGTVPPNLGTLPSLDHLNLSNNQLTGELSFPEDFINRIGKRLDVRGNSGLCTSSHLYREIKNISVYLETPLCLNNASGPRNDHKILTGCNENPYGCKRTTPSDQHQIMESSEASPCLNQDVISIFSFLVCYFLISVIIW